MTELRLHSSLFIYFSHLIAALLRCLNTCNSSICYPGRVYTIHLKNIKYRWQYRQGYNVLGTYPELCCNFSSSVLHLGFSASKRATWLLSALRCACGFWVPADLLGSWQETERGRCAGLILLSPTAAAFRFRACHHAAAPAFCLF